MSTRIGTAANGQSVVDFNTRSPVVVVSSMQLLVGINNKMSAFAGITLEHGCMLSDPWCECAVLNCAGMYTDGYNGLSEVACVVCNGTQSVHSSCTSNCFMFFFSMRVISGTHTHTSLR